MIQKNIFHVLAVLLLTIGVHTMIYCSGILPFFDFRLLDMALNLMHDEPEKPFASSVIVEIDEKSLHALGQWPWSRVITASVVQEILKAQPSALGIDIFFPESDRTSPVQIKHFYEQALHLSVSLQGVPSSLEDHDVLFADVLASGPSVLSVFASTQPVQTPCELPAEAFSYERAALLKTPYLLCNLTRLQEAAANIGFINASVDKDGVLRRQLLALEYQGRLIPSLVLAMIEQVDPSIRLSALASLDATKVSFLGKEIIADRHMGVINDIYGKKAFQHVSAVDLMTGEVDPSVLTGKFVFFGATAAGLFDQYVTSKGEIVPGVYAHASLMENMLGETLLYQPENSKRIAFGFSIVIGLVLFWFIAKKRYLFSWGIYLSTFGASVLATFVCLKQALYPSLGYFIVPFSFLFFIISLFFAVLHYTERKQFLEDLGEAHSATIDSMTMVAESRDVETGTHIVRTKEYVKLLAEYLRKNSVYKELLNPALIDLMYRAAPLHDIGKVGIPDAILRKKGRLDDAETAVMKQHALMGKTIIENAINSYNKTNAFLIVAVNIAYTHHEKWDGTGYPQGLKGEEIPLEGRLMALADVYDALISKRCYKEAMDFESAEAIILEGRGTHFDPVLVQAFSELKERFREIALWHKEQFDETDM
jgi:adenylate cyclase